MFLLGSCFALDLIQLPLVHYQVLIDLLGTHRNLSLLIHALLWVLK